MTAWRSAFLIRTTICQDCRHKFEFSSRHSGIKKDFCDDCNRKRMNARKRKRRQLAKLN